MRTYTFFSDPSHAWLKVPRKALTELGIEKKITHYSFVYGDYVYLEEDCDAYLFLEAAHNHGWELRIKEEYTDKLSKIRSYRSYEVPE